MLLPVNKLLANIRCLITDRSCYAIERARAAGISYYELVRKNSPRLNASVQQQLCQDADYIVLAGYLSILLPSFIEAFVGKIINIHPSLLPKYGGKGMHGMHVHQAVIAAGETESGCSTHYVVAEIDAGEVIAQARVKLVPDETPESLQTKIAREEHPLLIKTLQKLLEKTP